MAKRSDSSLKPPRLGGRLNVGAYQQPFSGVGLEFEPLGAPPHDARLVLHEVGYWPRNRAWDYPSVYSPFWRVYYDYERGHAMRFGDSVTQFDPASLYVIPDHRRFDCTGDPPVPKFWIHFSCAWSIERVPLPLVVPLDSVLEGMLKQVPRLFRRRTPDQRDTIRRLGMALLVYTLNHPHIPRGQRLPEPVSGIVQEINRDPARRWSNPEFARVTAMSTEGFIRRFRRWTGETPMAYVQQVRIREACRRLLESTASIEEIADATGFPDRFYFSRVFKKHTGISPARYRHDRTGQVRR